MNSAQRRKQYRKTGKVINKNTIICFFGHEDLPTAIGYWCPKCKDWGNLPDNIK